MIKRATMSAFGSMPTNRYNVRSISFPARSHPTVAKIEEVLKKLSSWQLSSSTKVDTICVGLSGLTELYRSIEDFLNLPQTQQALTDHQHQKWVNELLDGSVRYLDICSNTRDAILSMKENVRELQSALRRSKGGELSIESYVNAYICTRKKMKKETVKSIASLKQMNSTFEATRLLDLNHHLAGVVRMIREASLFTISIFRSLLSFLSVPMSKPKPTRWALVFKLVHKGVVACEGQHDNMNELESVDVAVSNLLHQILRKGFEAENTQTAQTRLEALDASIEDFENGLDSLFKHLIRTRVFLLNILSH